MTYCQKQAIADEVNRIIRDINSDAEYITINLPRDMKAIATKDEARAIIQPMIDRLIETGEFISI